MQVGPNKVVSIEYVLKGDDGQEIDKSQPNKPLAYLHGVGNLVAGLEKALTGKSAGESIEIVVPPAEGYGKRDEKLIRKIPLRKIRAPRVEVGKRYPAQMDQGMALVLLTAVDGDYATVDPNHPLCDMNLHFSVKVANVRDATAEELAHGHVHGEGGHDH